MIVIPRCTFPTCVYVALLPYIGEECGCLMDEPSDMLLLRFTLSINKYYEHAVDTAKIRLSLSWLEINYLPFNELEHGRVLVCFCCFLFLVILNFSCTGFGVKSVFFKIISLLVWCIGFFVCLFVCFLFFGFFFLVLFCIWKENRSCCNAN